MKKLVLIGFCLLAIMSLCGCPSKTPVSPSDNTDVILTPTPLPTLSPTPILTSYIKATWSVSGCPQLILFLEFNGVPYQSPITLLPGTGNGILWSNIPYGEYTVGAKGFGTYTDVSVGPVNMAVTLYTAGSCTPGNEYLNFN